jgi:hypothetical protein
MKPVAKLFLPAIALAAAMTLAPMPGHAQTAPNADALGGVGSSHTVTVRAKVHAINQKTREVTLIGPAHDVFTVHAGDEVRNLDQVRKGDTVVVRYTRSAVLVLNGPGQPTPDNSATLTAARAAPGQLPSGVAAGRLVVTGTVVGVDLDDHTLQLVNPNGGRVVTVDVTDPQRQQQMASVKVGDKITAILSAALAVSVEPVR